MKQKLGFDLVLLGAPASGKDTQAELLCRKYALKPVESGKFLRGLEQRKTSTGRLVLSRLEKGQLAPTNIIKEFISANLNLAPKDKNLVFVGNPRLKPEAEFLKKNLDNLKRDYLVFYINLPLKEIWQRSEKRMRNVDDSKYVQERINWTNKQVSKTVKYFQKLRKLRFINGNQTISNVNKDIVKEIRDYKRSKSNKAA